MAEFFDMQKAIASPVLGGERTAAIYNSIGSAKVNGPGPGILSARAAVAHGRPFYPS